MKITFISNYLTHHQIPFSEKMAKMPEVEYCFISTCPMNEERIQMGWKNEISYPFELKAYQGKKNQRKAEELALESDVVIIGSASDRYIVPRLKKKKLTFRYAERFYKKGLNIKNLGHAAVGTWIHHGRFQKYPLYMLCASGYTASDCALFGNYLKKMYKWGYFPKFRKYKEGLNKESEKKCSILWAGRMIPYKHPEMVVFLAEELKKRGYRFRIQMIGDGKLKNSLQKMIDEKKISDCIELLGNKKPEQVRIYMEHSHIYLLTSDFYEGWGAVLNEAMNSKCAVVASHAAGSVPFLIKDGQNGLIYENEKQEHFNQQVIRLIENQEYRNMLGENAYKTIADLWNAETAAERFLKLSKKLLSGDAAEEVFPTGPCSSAEIIKNDWYQCGEK